MHKDCITKANERNLVKLNYVKKSGRSKQTRNFCDSNDCITYVACKSPCHRSIAFQQQTVLTAELIRGEERKKPQIYNNNKHESTLFNKRFHTANSRTITVFSERDPSPYNKCVHSLST